MLEYDDGVYPVVKTTKENTDDIIDYLNNYAAEKGITDSKGNKVVIDKNKANTMYMMLFGVGYLSTILQKLIRSAADSNSIQNSSAKQLDLLAEIMHTSRKAPTYSTIECMITYELSVERPSIQLDETTYLTVQQTDGRVLTFVPSAITILDAYYYNPFNIYTASVQFRCTEAGPIYITDNIITSFAVPVEGIVSINNKNCIKGAEEETTEQMRHRLQQRQVSNTRVDRCSLALSELLGVSKASVLFNTSIDTTFDIVQDNQIQISAYHSSDGYGPFIIPPRQACVFISGISDEISSTFYNHMFCNTSNRSHEKSVFREQSYTTRAGQNLSFYYTSPINKFVSVTIYTLNPVTQEVSDQIKDAVVNYIASLNIGQSISDGEIIKNLYTLYPDLEITGVTFNYDDYYITSATTENATTLAAITAHLNTDNISPGDEDSDEVFGGETVKIYDNMIVVVSNDDDVYNVPYIYSYNPDSQDYKWTAQKYYDVYPEMRHEVAHYVTAYPYEQIQTNLYDSNIEHIKVVVGRAE